MAHQVIVSAIEQARIAPDGCLRPRARRSALRAVAAVPLRRPAGTVGDLSRDRGTTCPRCPRDGGDRGDARRSRTGRRRRAARPGRIARRAGPGDRSDEDRPRRHRGRLRRQAGRCARRRPGRSCARDGPEARRVKTARRPSASLPGRVQHRPVGRGDPAWPTKDSSCSEQLGYPFYTWYFRYEKALVAAVRGDVGSAMETADAMTSWAVSRGAGLMLTAAEHIRVLSANHGGGLRERLSARGGHQPRRAPWRATSPMRCGW